MRRREFITLLVGSAAIWPLLVRAQQTGKLWRICYLSAVSRESSSRSYAALQQGMRDLGYVEGKDFVLEWRSVEGKYERFSEIVAEPRPSLSRRPLPDLRWGLPQSACRGEYCGPLTIRVSLAPAGALQGAT